MGSNRIAGKPAQPVQINIERIVSPYLILVLDIGQLREFALFPARANRFRAEAILTASQTLYANISTA